ncbi:MAG TPA: kelch repeat-containing protein, partial [Acidobacteriaceae bacterium]|nr:kelch repeat-containing protein [Acidobacteriaceae bacterium]
MRKLIGSASALVLLLLFPFLVHATFPTVATDAWSPAQPLTSARSGAATVMLQDGRLLIIGGNSASGSLASVDIVDTAGNIMAGPPMNVARSQHTATVLQDGRVLVVGGVDVSGNPIGTAEIFDPAINASQANPWTSTGPLVQARSGHTATLLNNSTVLISGGSSGSQVLNTLEVFNAAAGSNGSFTLLPATMSSARTMHAAALLEDGRVLIVGGWDGSTVAPQPPATVGAPHALAGTDIYDPSTQQVRAGPALNVARMHLTATTQLDGQVFVAGGNDGNQDLTSTETFDPTASTQPASFTLGSLSLTTPRSNHLAFLLPHNGGTLLVGGTSSGKAIATAELYMPVYLSQTETATLTPVPNAMSTARVYATGSPLSDGSVASINDGLLLIAGGTDGSGNTLSSAEYFGFTWVKTDALDYAPGTLVNITGGGFQPGETVTLHFQEFPYLDTPPDATAVAQADGTFSNDTFAPDNHDLNTGFFLTATGSASGRQAQTVFTDSNPNQVTVGTQNAPKPVPAGAQTTFPITVAFNG